MACSRPAPVAEDCTIRRWVYCLMPAFVNGYIAYRPFRILDLVPAVIPIRCTRGGDALYVLWLSSPPDGHGGSFLSSAGGEISCVRRRLASSVHIPCRCVCLVGR